MAFATIGTTGIADDAVTSAKVAPGVVDTEAQPNQAPIIINGDMEVAQRGTSTTGITTSAGYYSCDRWQWAINHNGTVTITQESLTSGDAFADGFSKSFKVDVTTADSSLASDQYAIVRQQLEGQNVQVFKKGTSNAEKYTLSFWVKATKTGTNILELWDNTNSRNCHVAYTVSSSDTWEKKVVSLPADTTGAITNNNASGMIVAFWLGAGSNFTSGTLNTTWAANDNTTRAVGQVNNLDNASNNWEITGVQLEVGEFTSSTIPPFKHESYGDNLERCLRYFYCPNMNGESYTSIGQGNAYNTSRIDVPVFFPVPMRTAPSVSLSGGTALRFEGNAEDITASAISIGNVGTTTGDVYNNSLSGPNQGYAYRLYLNDSGTTKMFFNSEL